MTSDLTAFDTITASEFYMIELGRTVAMLEQNVPDGEYENELEDYINRLKIIKLRLSRGNK